MEDKKDFVKGYLIGQHLNIIMDTKESLWTLQNGETLIILAADTVRKNNSNMEVE